MRISLESSERIRKQQKELIHLLQKSHSLSDSANASVLSMNSLQSLSTISHRDGYESLTPSVIAAENKSWLDASEKYANVVRVKVYVFKRQC